MAKVRIATRGSDTRTRAARYVASRLARELGAECELVIVQTTGDRIQDVSLAKIGGKGLFIKEVEETLLDGRADVAVHSAKDLPAALAAGLKTALMSSGPVWFRPAPDRSCHGRCGPIAGPSEPPGRECRC
ncbi:MAG: hypothetical protein HC807_08425 [Gammaproteobacteria bacterium]|nr:hypothetical protein [Gammaproteobacteria bacterium]